MRTLRTARSARTARPARLIAVTGAALAALALTACDNGMGTRDEGAAGGSTSTSRSTGSSGSSEGGTGTSGGSTTEGSTGGTSTGGGSTGGTSADKAASKGGTSDPSDPENRVTCNGSHTTVTAQPVSRPLNHLLITVKNTGSKYCDLYYNPTVRFGEAQSAPRVFEESQPQAVVTLAPGESGYAGVLLSAADGSGGEGTTEKKVVIHFQGTEAGSDAGSPASPALPAEGVHVDNSVAVTYWQSTMEDALQY
ncbi:DUF4232 domain-containing protein [Streptomyces caniscabiei]|uniref:DUF4232 domain-containing protein n=1 Tax=Streptomyces caniscabiei TaxID=2746961 RepID=A0ABU4N303_9ACTN|nr:DUF4232 domain-containing protein [Streptomyces caniscabiei]MBE4736817.1 DUF4232 domain-containing protein [Streptomyces caniscabiei]MBE4762100.1 DUF4232 domain-containing protein [Streptomyces caniscabiei]MBE4775389.1 DUF4232 domain-containing protein [Streptomyces caniscabiei]MBE4787066.1 DUF4232 domain-containing protein [Streptomyces caniscabiei]MBE4794679.1 DUF4232 domain-containing protein [Streptomyces caniscabiei]